VARDVDLKHLRYFLAVADEGTFTAAADRLHMTQPALSRAIRALEGELDTVLFLRTPQGAELTEAGRVLDRDARNLLESAEAALARAARIGREGPRLRVTARGCDVDVLQRLVDSYNARYPDALPAHAAMVDWRLQSDQLRAGAADVTLLRDPFDDRGLDSELVSVDPRVAVLPGNHALAGRETIHRRELAGEAFPVWPDLSPAETAYWTGTDLAHHDWRPGPVVHDGAQFVGTIRLGQAIGFLARPHLPASLPAGISVVPVHGLSHSTLRIAWPATATSPDLARFVRHTTESVPAARASWPLASWRDHEAAGVQEPVAGNGSSSVTTLGRA
jgi:DNA-binding transcriptional LysR family regulator